MRECVITAQTGDGDSVIMDACLCHIAKAGETEDCCEQQSLLKVHVPPWNEKGDRKKAPLALREQVPVQPPAAAVTVPP